MNEQATERNLIRQIILLACAAFVGGASARIADPLLPQLALSFSVSISEASWAVSAFALTYGSMQLLFGPLGDRYGKFRVISYATLACVVGGIGVVLAQRFDMLILARALTGATAGGLIPLSMAWIGDNVPYEKRQPVLAYFLTGQIVGIISGQVFGGLLADLVGWRGAFWFMLASYVIVGGALVLEVRRSPGIDAAGQGNAENLTYWKRLSGVFERRWARIILTLVCIEGGLVFGGLAFIPSYLHANFGISLSLAGLCMATFGAGGLSYTMFSSYFVKKLGERGLSVSGGFVSCAAFTCVLLADHWAWGIPAAYLSGMGYYMLHNTFQINATQMAPEHRGTAVALFAATFFLGQSGGVAINALLASAYGMRSVFIAPAVLLPTLAIVFAQLLKSRDK